MEVIEHEIHPVKHTVHGHEALARAVIEPQHPAFALCCDFVHILTEARTVEHIEKIFVHCSPPKVSFS